MRRPEAGAALIITLMLTALLAFLGGALVFIMDAETAVSANHQVAQEVRDAAESGINCAIAELGALADWGGVPGGLASASLRCLDPSVPAGTPDGIRLDVSRLTTALQLDSDARFGGTTRPDTPRWIVFAHGPLTHPSVRGRPYVLVWVADDVDDGDGQPAQDTNGTLIVRAHAYGIRGARSAVEALVAREDGEGSQPSGVRLLGWRME